MSATTWFIFGMACGAGFTLIVLGMCLAIVLPDLRIRALRR